MQEKGWVKGRKKKTDIDACMHMHAYTKTETESYPQKIGPLVF
jgi:hypothetical protein